MNPNAYDVFVYMRSYYMTCRKVVATDDLAAVFPELGIREIMRGEQMFSNWLVDMRA